MKLRSTPLTFALVGILVFATSNTNAADRVTTADLSCVGYLYYDHEFGHDLTAYPNIERWRQAIAALPGWKHPYDLMPGHPIPAGALS